MDITGIPATERQASRPATRTVSRIAETLRGRTILMTGTTGFLAKAILEKILRDIPDVRRTYVIIRSRGGANGSRLSAEDRLRQDVFTSGAFDRLRDEHDETWQAFFSERVQAVSGDLSQERLGLDPETYHRLVGEVDLVVNSAATVSFDERLDTAIEINTLGPSRLLAFARDCGEARGEPVPFVHISTAYVNGWRDGSLPEEPFAVGDSMRALRGEKDAPRLDPEEEIRWVRETAERMEEESRKDRLVSLGMERAHHYGWNDTYTFTKAMGEMVLCRDRGDVPVVILRPSIIESSMNEPQPGWLDGYRMADPIIMGYGKGLLKDIPANPDTVLDFVPLDFVVNASLAAMARVLESREGVKIYQVATGMVSPLTAKDMTELGRDYFNRNPMIDRDGRPIQVTEVTFPTPEEFQRKLTRWYLRPLKVAEWIASRLPLVPRRLKARIISRKHAVEQAIYYSEIYGPYLTQTFAFDTSATLDLFERLPEEDKEAFPFDVRGIDWRHYVQDIHIPGLKYNVLKMGTTTGRLVRSVADEADREMNEWLGTGIETLHDLLRRSGRRFKEQLAVDMERNGGDRIAYTYGRLLDECRRTAETYAAWGAARGDRIVLWAENSPRWGIAYFGATASGITVIPVDTQTTPDELGRIIRFTKASLVVATESTFRRMNGDGADLGVPCLNLDREMAPFEGTPERTGPPRPSTWGQALPDDVASIIFTAGTTVDPKAVLLSHRNFVSDAIAVAKVLRPLPTDRFLSVLPLHHVFEFSGGFLVPMLGGCRITYVEALKSRRILETMRKTETTVMLGVPRLFEILHDGIIKQASKSPIVKTIFRVQLSICRAWQRLLGWNPGRILFGRVHQSFGGELRAFVSGGAALDAEICRNFIAMGFPFCEGYGMTEASPVLTVNPMGRSKPGSVGPPLPGVELRIDDADENGVGEIVVRGEMLMRGYLDNPEATGRILRHGWLHTGDLGYQDADGYVFITGRSKDLIITASGKNVYPDEVETLYRRSLPHVKEMCVVGIPSETSHGEEVHAVVVPDWKEWPDRPDMEAWQKEVAAAVRAASESLPTYQRIQKVHYWRKDLPRTQTLKVQRMLVQEAILSGESPSDSTAEGPEAWRVAEKRPVTLEPAEYQRLVEIVGSISRVSRSEISGSSHLQFDLGMDSLMRLELLAALEEAYAVAIPDAVAPDMTTVDAVAEIIQGRREASSTGQRAAYWDRVLTGRAGSNPDEEDKPKGPFALLFESGFRRAGKILYDKYFRLEVRGIENIPEDGAYIIVANHTSHLDSGAIVAGLGKQAKGLRLVGAKDYFFTTRLKSWFFRNIFNAIPFDRRDHFIDGLRLCRAALDRGHKLLIFPEGTRSVTGELQPFKAGIGVLAVNLGVPVVPTRVQGSFESLPKGSRWPRRSTIRVSFGRPLAVTDQGASPGFEVYREFANEVRRRVEALE